VPLCLRGEISRLHARLVESIPSQCSNPIPYSDRADLSGTLDHAPASDLHPARAVGPVWHSPLMLNVRDPSRRDRFLQDPPGPLVPPATFFPRVPSRRVPCFRVPSQVGPGHQFGGSLHELKIVTQPLVKLRLADLHCPILRCVGLPRRGADRKQHAQRRPLARDGFMQPTAPNPRARRPRFYAHGNNSATFLRASSAMTRAASLVGQALPAARNADQTNSRPTTERPGVRPKSRSNASQVL
jgi:hypothetical protein